MIVTNFFGPALWQIVTFLPYWYWAAPIALCPTPTPPSAANATSDATAAVTAAIIPRGRN